MRRTVILFFLLCLFSADRSQAGLASDSSIFYREISRVDFLVTPDADHRLFFQFPDLLGYQFERAALGFTLAHPSGSSATAAVFSGGTEIFREDLHSTLEHFWINLLDYPQALAPPLEFKFYSSQGEYTLLRASFTAFAREIPMSPTPLPPSLWFFGSGLGSIIFARRVRKN